ncbi:response regulator transcription factor [Variovorax sp. HJSM1_2]|uniref:response regulator transcription factor n=1 Tax=Variovorax sp. HJSM1_2 TaxID=3366263 RepID=UPI003BC18912
MEQKKLLIVDDSRVSRMMIRSLVQAKRPHWTLLEAANGDEALASVAEGGVDYCTMDINMPGMDGTEVTERLLKKHPTVRLVLFSANVQESQKARASALGVLFVAKPVTERSVSEALQYFESTPS